MRGFFSLITSTALHCMLIYMVFISHVNKEVFFMNMNYTPDRAEIRDMSEIISGSSEFVVYTKLLSSWIMNVLPDSNEFITNKNIKGIIRMGITKDGNILYTDMLESTGSRFLDNLISESILKKGKAPAHNMGSVEDFLTPIYFKPK